MAEEQSPTKRTVEDAGPSRRVKQKTSSDAIKTGKLFTHPTHKLMEAGNRTIESKIRTAIIIIIDDSHSLSLH